MDNFDPDQYLAEKTPSSSKDFDPDSYLAEKTGKTTLASAGKAALGYVSKGIKAINSVTIDPVDAAISAKQYGNSGWDAYKNQFANMHDTPITGKDIYDKAGLSNQPQQQYSPTFTDKNGQQQVVPGNIPSDQKPMLKSPAEVAGEYHDLVVNPVNLLGPAVKGLGKAVNFLTPVGEAIEVGTKANSSAIKAAAQRLGFEATPGMTSDSHVVQGLESSLSQSPTIPGALVRKSIKPVTSSLQNAAENLVSGADTSAYQAGDSAAKGVLASLGEKVNNVKMSYEPFNAEMPYMVPAAEDRWKLADQISKIGQQHLDPNEVDSLVRGTTNRIMGSQNLADLEETRKLIGQKITKAYSDNDRGLADTLTKIKDKLSDFRDDQFDKLARESRPGPGGAQMGAQMADEYKAAMASHHNLMNDLRDVGPLFGIKAKNPRDFIEAFNEIPAEQVAKKLFQSNDFQSLQKVQQYFPEEFNTIKNLKLQELRSQSLVKPLDPHNSPVDPIKLMTKINKLSPEVRTILFGDKAQTVTDMQTVMGSFPKYIGPSGTPEGQSFLHMGTQQAIDAGRYGVYKYLGSNSGAKALKSMGNVPKAISKGLSSTPNSAGPVSTGTINMVKDKNNPQHYSDGGTVQPPPPPPTNIDPQRAKDIQEGMRKAFHFASGGMVPGTPQVPANSPQNDTVLAKLTPGEVVLPLSVTQSANAPQRAKDFMASQLNQPSMQPPPMKAPEPQLQQPEQPMVPGAQPQPQMPAGGPDKWAADGYHNLKQHVDDSDRQWLENNKETLLLDPKLKHLLVTSSSFSPGSKPLDDIVQHLKDRMDKVKS